MATLLAVVPQPGQVVRVRSRQYLVEGVVPAPNPGDRTLGRLPCLHDDAQGMPWNAVIATDPRLHTSDHLAPGQA